MCAKPNFSSLSVPCSFSLFSIFFFRFFANIHLFIFLFRGLINHTEKQNTEKDQFIFKIQIFFTHPFCQFSSANVFSAQCKAASLRSVKARSSFGLSVGVRHWLASLSGVWETLLKELLSTSLATRTPTFDMVSSWITCLRTWTLILSEESYSGLNAWSLKLSKIYTQFAFDSGSVGKLLSNWLDKR